MILSKLLFLYNRHADAAMEHTRIPKDRTRSSTPAMPTPMADSPSQTAAMLIRKKAADLDAQRSPEPLRRRIRPGWPLSPFHFRILTEAAASAPEIPSSEPGTGQHGKTDFRKTADQRKLSLDQPHSRQQTNGRQQGTDSQKQAEPVFFQHILLSCNGQRK